MNYNWVMLGLWYFFYHIRLRGDLMFKKSRKLVAVMATVAVIISCITIGFANITNAQTPTKMKVGDYIQFGHYYGDPILWRVINVNANGSYFLLSDKILCLKSFDAEGDLAGGKGDKDRKINGSSYWKLSNIREWLNSSDKKVKYSSQVPDKTHVNGGINPYDAEAGFLSNFTADERAAIQPVTHKCILSIVDKSAAKGGTKAYDHGTSGFSTIMGNYDAAYYENVQDNVFLLDVKEIHDFVYNRKWETMKFPTVKAVANQSFIKKTLSSTQYWYYWLRSPYSVTSYSVQTVAVGEVPNGFQGYVDFAGADIGVGGVAPALNLKASISVSEGNGSISNPYISLK